MPAAPARLEVFPNPFNPRTTAAVDLAGRAVVTLTVHDLAGRRVRTLVDGPREAGRHLVPWTGRDDRGNPLASGTYLLRLRTAGATVVHPVVLVR